MRRRTRSRGTKGWISAGFELIRDTTVWSRSFSRHQIHNMEKHVFVLKPQAATTNGTKSQTPETNSSSVIKQNVNVFSLLSAQTKIHVKHPGGSEKSCSFSFQRRCDLSSEAVTYFWNNKRELRGKSPKFKNSTSVSLKSKTPVHTLSCKSTQQEYFV